jgi:hypothetical protein
VSAVRSKRRVVRTPAAPGGVSALDQARIERALQGRTRYRYVAPRVVSEGEGWKIVSPNCSRNIAADGGEIGIAWLLPAADPGPQTWLLHARDHVHGRWREQARGLTLDEALHCVCADPLGVYWP